MQASGIFNKTRPALPSVLPYREFIDFSDAPEIKNMFCYVIRHYGRVGLSVLIYRQPQKDDVVVICGDWNGNSLDLTTQQPSQLIKIANDFIKNDLTKFVKLLHLIKLTQAQFFFAIDDNNTLQLVDMQIAINKMVGPGMIIDLFGRIYNTQKIVVKPEIIDDRVYECLQTGAGSYSGDLILKPSVTKLRHLASGVVIPFYIELKR